MIRRSMSMAVLAATLLIGTGAQAADSPETLDAQCMVRASAAQTKLTGQGREVASNMVFYYMGRMIGRNPNVDIAKQARAALVQLSKDNGLVTAKRCDAELQAIMSRFQKDAATVNAKP